MTAATEGDKTSPALTYTPKKNLLLVLYLAIILFLVIKIYPYWYKLGFNFLIAGYFVFKEMRLATALYAFVIYIILYPLGQIKKFFDKKAEAAEEKYEEDVQPIRDEFTKDEARRGWFANQRLVIVLEWFLLCFYTMNAVVVGVIFFQPFSYERISPLLFFKEIMPSLPLRVVDWIPLAGMVDLTRPNRRLNLISAIGAGLVGLFQVVLNKKQSKRQLVMYLVAFPLGAFFITYAVPAGFEFALALFELLTVIGITIENIIGFFQKSKFFAPAVSQITKKT